MFIFLRVSSVVLALSFWFKFILFYVAVFYLGLSSSVVESSLSDPSTIYCFCCISHLSSGVFCCHFLLVSYCIQFVPCSCRLSSIAYCHCIFVLLLKKAFIVIAAGVLLSSGVFCCPRVVILIWIQFVLCSCLLSSIVFFRRWIFVVSSKYHLLFLLHFSSFFGCLLLSLPPRFELYSFSSMQLSFIFDCLLSLHLRFVIEKSIYCICCGVRLSSGVFCCPRVLILNRIHFVPCSCLLSSIVFCRWIFVWSKYHLLFCCIFHLSSGVFCCNFLLVSNCIHFLLCSCRLSSIASCRGIFVLLMKKAIIVFAAVFVFLRVSSVVLAMSFWFEFILFYVAVFYLRLSSSVVESSLSDPSIIYCFCCISHLSSGVFCCRFLLVSNCLHFLLCSCRLSSIASCRWIFVLLLKKAFILFAAVFVFLRVSSVVPALSFWFEFILFYVAVFCLRLSSSFVESSLSDPSIIYCFCCISHLSSGVFCCRFLLVSNCIHFLLCSCRLSSIASCRCIFVLLLKKHLLYLLRCSSFFGCLLLSSRCHSDLNSFCSM